MSWLAVLGATRMILVSGFVSPLLHTHAHTHAHTHVHAHAHAHAHTHIHTHTHTHTHTSSPPIKLSSVIHRPASVITALLTDDAVLQYNY